MADNRRKQAAETLCNDIAAAFEEVEDAVIEDASRQWDDVRIGIMIHASPAKYYTDNARERDGAKITANLRSLAPRLYNYIETHESTLDMKRPAVRRPTPVDGREDVYEGNVYLIDIFLE